MFLSGAHNTYGSRLKATHMKVVEQKNKKWLVTRMLCPTYYLADVTNSNRLFDQDHFLFYF